MKALVHIGPPKSGTTSIQAYLRTNRRQLANNHIATLASREWIRSLAAMFRENVPNTNWYRANNEPSKQSFEDFKQQATQRLCNEIKRLPSTTQLLVLSSEGLFSCRKSEMQTLQNFLGEYCEQVEIITYLRRQDLLAISKHKNKTRNKARVEPISERYQRNSDYDRQLQKWAAVFGREQIIVRRFPDSAPQKFDLLEQFQSELAERVSGWNGDFELPENRNVSWNWQATEFMRIANEVGARQLSDAEFHRRLVRQVDRQFTGGEKPSIDRRLAKAIVANYRESNENVRKAYFPTEDRLFHDDFSRYPETGGQPNQQMSVEMAVRLGIELMAGLSADDGDRYDLGNHAQRDGSLRGWVSRGRDFVARVRKLCRT